MRSLELWDASFEHRDGEVTTKTIQVMSPPVVIRTGSVIVQPGKPVTPQNVKIVSTEYHLVSLDDDRKTVFYRAKPTL
jgi:hypothetical protein